MQDNPRSRTTEACARFVQLMHARERDQFDEAAEAKRVLESLGIRVSFRRRSTGSPSRRGVTA